MRTENAGKICGHALRTHGRTDGRSVTKRLNPHTHLSTQVRRRRRWGDRRSPVTLYLGSNFDRPSVHPSASRVRIFCPHFLSASIRWAHSFLKRDPFLTIFAPFERGDRELSNGTKIIKNGSILRKLWNNRNKVINTLISHDSEQFLTTIHYFRYFGCHNAF